MGYMKELAIKEESMQIELFYEGARDEQLELESRKREAYQESLREDYSFEEYLEQERKTHKK